MGLIYIQHLPGQPKGGVQSCTRCGIALADNRNIMVGPGSDPNGYFWTNPQVYVAQDGESVTISSSQLNNGEKWVECQKEEFKN